MLMNIQANRTPAILTAARRATTARDHERAATTSRCGRHESPGNRRKGCRARRKAVSRRSQASQPISNPTRGPNVSRAYKDRPPVSLKRPLTSAKHRMIERLRRHRRCTPAGCTRRRAQRPGPGSPEIPAPTTEFRTSATRPHLPISLRSSLKPRVYTRRPPNGTCGIPPASAGLVRCSAGLQARGPGQN